MFSFRASAGSVEVAFTDASLDLQLRPADMRGSGEERLAAEFVGPFVGMRQVHGVDVAIVDSAGGEPPVADALVTTRRGITLMVRVADCVPVVLADPDAGVIGVAHAGRKGMAAGVVPNTVQVMRDVGATALQAWVGPRICGGCYEVPEEMRDEVGALVPAARAETTWGTPALDIGRGVAQQLVDLGVGLTDVPLCTREESTLHSYRRDGDKAGRFAGLVRLG